MIFTKGIIVTFDLTTPSQAIPDVPCLLNAVGSPADRRPPLARGPCCTQHPLCIGSQHPALELTGADRS